MTAPADAVETPDNATIAARSERQAMDWSLVLASQGIEVHIAPPAPDGRWLLIVPRPQHDRALESIRLFRLENRRWAWRQRMPGSELLFHWGAVVWAVALGWLHLVSGYLSTPGAFFSERFRNGQWWRAFTAVWLHADLAHFASNAAIGGLILGLAMARYGAGLTLLLSTLAGVVGNLAGAWIRLDDWLPGPARAGQDYVGLGASGMVMGAIGLLAAQAVPLWRLSRHATRTILGSLMGGAFLFLTVGSDPKSDLLAHGGGFAAGLFLGTMAMALKLERFSRYAGAAFATLFLGTWLIALR